ncbi:MAG: ATP-binding protein, partial [Chryseotalea sp.]
IINELVINSFKHAFHNVSAPTLLVRIDENNNHLEINITDNGVGIKDPENLQTKSFGFKLVKTLLQQLKATLIAKNDKGTSFYITMPLTIK